MAIPFSIGHPIASITNALEHLCNLLSKFLESLLYSYQNGVNYLLAPNAMHHVLAEAVPGIRSCAQLHNVLSVSYAQTV